MNNLNQGTFPLVSIVTVTYNAIETIEQTILSVINQDYPNIEYIIIDGGSTDGTIDVIKKYEKSLSYWISEPDKGLYDAMNKGIVKATGEWITMRNSGDVFAEKDSLSKLFKEDIDDDITFVHADCYRTTPWGWYYQKPSDISMYKETMPIVHPATFVRTIYHKSHLFDLRYKVNADYNLVYEACENKIKFKYVPIPLVVFPTGGYSTMHWKETFIGKKHIQGYYDGGFKEIFTRMELIYLSVMHFVKDILLRIPYFSNKRDERNVKNMNPYPLNLPNYF